jgi:hypothetical protein
VQVKRYSSRPSSMVRLSITYTAHAPPWRGWQVTLTQAIDRSIE